MKKDKIFISIASYRDPELIPTIDDCIKNADNPKKLVFCIFNQYSPEDPFNDFEKYRNDKRFKFIDLNYKECRGVCFARSIINSHYANEEYYLQLDSHHRFSQGWDTGSKSKLVKLKESGFKKPLLSSYLPAYDPHNDPEGRHQNPWRLLFDRFMPEGPLFLKPHVITENRGLERARFLGGHFIFTTGKFCTEVPYDPFLYFHGEETSLSVRAFTHGYDIFHLDEPLAWHYYERAGSKRHWDDSKMWAEFNSWSFARYKSLLGVDGTSFQDFGPYGLGNQRSLEEYEKFAGINFKNRSVHIDAQEGTPPPVSLEGYEEKFINSFKYCIDISKEQLPEKDYDFFAVAFKNSSGEEICRVDLSQPEIDSALNSNPSDEFVRLWREFSCSIVPSSWVVWPRSISKGYLDRIEGDIPQS